MYIIFFFQMKGHVRFQGQIVMKYWKCIDKISKSFSLEPLGQFNLDLAQRIRGWRRFKGFFFKWKATTSSKWNNIEIAKNTSKKNLKNSQEPLDLFQPNLPQSIVGWKGFKFAQMKGRSRFQGEIYEIAKIHWQNLKFFFSKTTGPISTKLKTNILGRRGFDFEQIRNIHFSKRT